MNTNQRFLKWYKENEVRFHQGVFSDKDIAYSAWLEATKQAKIDIINKIKE